MPVPTSNIAPNKCAATCNGYMQSSLSQWGIFLFFFFCFPPNLTLSLLFCLWATPCPVQPLFSFPWLRRAGSSSVPPEQGTRSHLQYKLKVQLLPSSYQKERMKPINNNLLFPDPFKHFMNSFKLSHSSARGYNPLWQMQAWGSISVCSQSKLKHTALQGSRAKPTLLQRSFAYRFCPSVLFQKHSVPLLFQIRADIRSKFIFIEVLVGNRSPEQVKCVVSSWAGWRWGRYTSPPQNQSSGNHVCF